ncbi:replicative DNA helicase [Microgenomates group bacterium]|nr:replicative DNA helicase [Microgenomates group bacterium]
MPDLKTPPHDLPAERSVLAATLFDPQVITKIANIITPASFYEPKHQLIFQACRNLYEKNAAIDVLTVAAELKKMKATGVDAAYLGELVAQLVTSANVVEYARLVADNYVKRQIISLGGDLATLAFDESKETRDILDLAEQKVLSISANKRRRNFIPIQEALSDSFDRLEELRKNGAAFQGLPTGFTALDNILSGMHPSNLLILAARPGTGKTAFALNIAQYLTVVKKKRVAFFSLEMSSEELVNRLLSAQGDIDGFKLKTGRLDQDVDLPKLSEAMGVLSEAEIFIDDTPSLSIFEMRTQARRLMSEHQIDMLIVDYLQLATGRTKDNRVQEVAEISQGLKNIARELKIPVLALSQLNRALESRAGTKVPQLSDLRESGAIEQDADVVMFLYRKDEDTRDQVTVKISKHRNGPPGEITLGFLGKKLKFVNLETSRQP